MTDPKAFLTAMQLSDSMLPIGTYTASYGVEQYINNGYAKTAEDLGELVEGYLRGIIGPTEIVALGHAHRSAATNDLEAILAADERLAAATLPVEFRESSQKAGDKLLSLLRQTEDELFAGASDDSLITDYASALAADRTVGHYPVIMGLVSQRAGIDCLEAALVSAYATTTGLLGAAQRLGRFGHTDIQSQLSSLFEVIETICESYYDAELQTMCSFAPLADVMGMTHQWADRRLFMS